jgi:hypothetical protein
VDTEVAEVGRAQIYMVERKWSGRVVSRHKTISAWQAKAVVVWFDTWQGA